MLENHQNTIDTTSRVMAALESIRPFLNSDGGDIELVKV